MREIWTIDCETDPFDGVNIPQPFLWGAYNGEIYLEFKTADDVVDYFEDLPVLLYAHNGGKFDWHYLLHRLVPWEPLTVINGRLAKFKIGEAEYRDSYNILPIPLAQFEKTEIDYNLFTKKMRVIPKHWEEIRAYLRSDCVNLYRLVREFIDRYGLNLTLAGAALKQWQKITKSKAPETSRDFYQGVAPYYYGGRVECFEMGLIDRPFQVVDINSAYPDAMKNLHPYGGHYSTSTKLPRGKGAIQRSFITLTAASTGALPARDISGALSFPHDGEQRLFHVTGWEYLTAKETDSLIDHKIVKVLTFADSIRFDQYIDHFYAMKEKAPKGSPDYIFAKLFLNTLYGKFGANPDNYDEFTIVQPRHIAAACEEENYDFCAYLNQWALLSRPLGEEKHRYYNVAVAASITGFVRAKLWRAIRKCSGVIYCDTDSIAATHIDGLPLDATKLGYWDVEARCTFGAVAGKKLYAFETDKTDDKGARVWKKASKGAKLTAQEIVRIAQGEEIVYHPEAPSYSLKRGVGFVDRRIKRIG